MVAPHMGAWIEISRLGNLSGYLVVAPHMGAWIEIKHQFHRLVGLQSHPTWVRGLKYQLAV